MSDRKLPKGLVRIDPSKAERQRHLFEIAEKQKIVLEQMAKEQEIALEQMAKEQEIALQQLGTSYSKWRRTRKGETMKTESTKRERQLSLFDRDDRRQKPTGGASAETPPANFEGSTRIDPSTDKTLPGVPFGKWRRTRKWEEEHGVDNESPF